MSTFTKSIINDELLDVSSVAKEYNPATVALPRCLYINVPGDVVVDLANHPTDTKRVYTVATAGFLAISPKKIHTVADGTTAGGIKACW